MVDNLTISVCSCILRFEFPSLSYSFVRKTPTQRSPGRGKAAPKRGKAGLNEEQLEELREVPPCLCTCRKSASILKTSH